MERQNIPIALVVHVVLKSNTFFYPASLKKKRPVARVIIVP